MNSVVHSFVLDSFWMVFFFFHLGLILNGVVCLLFWTHCEWCGVFIVLDSLWMMWFFFFSFLDSFLRVWCIFLVFFHFGLILNGVVCFCLGLILNSVMFFLLFRLGFFLSSDSLEVVIQTSSVYHCQHTLHYPGINFTWFKQLYTCNSLGIYH